MKRFSILAIAALLACGCALEEMKHEALGLAPVRVDLTFSTRWKDGESTRSMYSPEVAAKKTTMYLLAYVDGVLDESVSAYYPTYESVRPLFDPSKTYDLYFLSNTTKFIGSDWMSGGLDLRDEANIESLLYAVDDYAVFEQTGFPTANAYKGWTVTGATQHFELLAMMSRVVIRLNKVEKDNVHLTVTGASIRQAARKMRPFGETFKAESEDDMLTMDADKTDRASESDIDKMQSEQAVVLYVMENAQGDLLPGNTSQALKNPENDELGSRKELITCVDIVCSATTQASTVGKIQYTICPGHDNTTNFDIFRGETRELNVNFNTDNISDVDGKVATEGQNTNRAKFVTSRDKEENGEIELRVGWGTIDELYFYPENVRDELVDFDVKYLYNGKEYPFYQSEDFDMKIEETTWKGRKAHRITVTGTKSIQAKSGFLCKYHSEGTYSNGSWISRNNIGTMSIPEAVGSDADYIPSSVLNMRIASKDRYNGTANVAFDFNVKVYYDIYPMEFQISESGELQVRTNDPIGLPFAITYDFKSSGRSLSGTEVFCGEADYYAWNDEWVFTPKGNVLGGENRRKWQKVATICSSGEVNGLKNAGVRLNIQITPITKENFHDYCALSSTIWGPHFADGTKFYMPDRGKVYFGPNDVWSPVNGTYCAPFYYEGMDDQAYVNGSFWGKWYAATEDRGDHTIRWAFWSEDPGRVGSQMKIGKTIDSFGRFYGRIDISNYGAWRTPFYINYGTPGYNTGAVRTDKTADDGGYWAAQLNETATEYRGCPFQCVNGGMYIYKMDYSYSIYSPAEYTWSESGRPAYRFGCECYPPGRDLFEKDETGSLAWFRTHINDTNEAGSGKYHMWFVDHGYSTLSGNNAFLTVNGCASWPGEDHRPGGIQTGRNTN